MKERLIELLKEHCVLRQDVLDCTNRKTDDCPECLADHLLADGWIRPPLDIGDKVWIIDWCNEINCYEVSNMRYTKDLNGQRYSYDALMFGKNGADIGFFDSDIGKYVFLTKEEAEHKLKERKEDGKNG